MNYAEALREANGRLIEAGVADHETDVKLLLSFLTGQHRSYFLTHGDEELPEVKEKEFFELIAKRAEHIPTQLLTGTQDFMGFEFDVEEGVLIPRLDTEFLVEEALREITDGAKILDLCCGSGCIAISLAKLINGASVYASDISDKAINLTQRNAEKLGADIHVLKSDLFEGIEGTFDFIISNPPYIRSGEIDTLMEEVRAHEPREALDGGEDGLGFYSRIAREAYGHLCGGGMLIFEIGYDQGGAVKDILTASGYNNIDVYRDYSDNERVIKCLKGWTT